MNTGKGKKSNCGTGVRFLEFPGFAPQGSDIPLCGFPVAPKTTPF